MSSVDFKKISAYQTLDESPGYLLWRVSTQWRTTIEKTLKAHGLTHPQFVVLATTAWLTKKSSQINQVEISRAAGLDPNTTSQIIRSLETKKLIKRTHKKDERSKNPLLTILGSKVLNAALPAVEEADADFFAPLAKDYLVHLIGIFHKLLGGNHRQFTHD